MKYMYILRIHYIYIYIYIYLYLFSWKFKIVGTISWQDEWLKEKPLLVSWLAIMYQKKEKIHIWLKVDKNGLISSLKD